MQAQEQQHPFFNPGNIRFVFGFSSCVDAHRRAQDLICLVFRLVFASLRHAFQSLLRGSRRRRCLCGRHRLPGTCRAAGEPGEMGAVMGQECDMWKDGWKRDESR